MLADAKVTKEQMKIVCFDSNIMIKKRPRISKHQKYIYGNRETDVKKYDKICNKKCVIVSIVNYTLNYDQLYQLQK